MHTAKMPIQAFVKLSTRIIGRILSAEATPREKAAAITLYAIGASTRAKWSALNQRAIALHYGIGEHLFDRGMSLLRRCGAVVRRHKAVGRYPRDEWQDSGKNFIALPQSILKANTEAGNRASLVALAAVALTRMHPYPLAQLAREIGVKGRRTRAVLAAEAVRLVPALRLITTSGGPTVLTRHDAVTTPDKNHPGNFHPGNFHPAQSRWETSSPHEKEPLATRAAYPGGETRAGARASRRRAFKLSSWRVSGAVVSALGALDSHCIRARGEGLDLETWRELLILLVGQAAAVRHTALGTPAGLDEVTDLAEYLSHEAEGEISVECATRTIAVEIAKAIRNRKPVRSLGFIAIPLAVAVKYGSFELFDSALEEIKTARGRAAEAQRVAKEATERREQQELAAQLRADRQRTLDADAARALHPSLAEDARGFAKLLANVSRATGRPRPEIIDAAVRIVADMQRGRPRVIHRYRSWRALEPQLKAEFDALAAAAG